MNREYRVTATGEGGRELLADTGHSWEQAARWADRFKADRKQNVIVTVIESEGAGGKQASRWIAW